MNLLLLFLHLVLSSFKFWTELFLSFLFLHSLLNIWFHTWKICTKQQTWNISQFIMTLLIGWARVSHILSNLCNIWVPILKNNSLCIFHPLMYVVSFSEMDCYSNSSTYHFTHLLGCDCSFWIRSQCIVFVNNFYDLLFGHTLKYMYTWITIWRQLEVN